MIEFKEIGLIRTDFKKNNVPRQPRRNDHGHYLEIKKEYQKGLYLLDKFRYIYVIFYLDRLNGKEIKKNIIKNKLTVHKEENTPGLFATRSPRRINPLGLSVVEIKRIEENIIYITGIDALDETPIIDIKPYIKELDNKNDANSGWLKKDNMLGDSIYLYTDGACSGNPGPGGYAAVIIDGNTSTEIKGFSPQTTNNRMELMAVIEGLNALAHEKVNKSRDIKLVSDSNYVLQGLKSWLDSWKQNFWKTSSNKPVKNKDLWQKLDDLRSRYNLEYIKVKGHSGNKYNELVDTIAREEIKKNVSEA